MGLASKARDWDSESRRPRRSSDYEPPTNAFTMRLSEALAGTKRLPPAAELKLGDRETPDERLFCAGDISLLKGRCVAIVGTRQISEDGARRTHRLARELVDAGFVVMSGLAAGVDTVALTTAIERGGRVIAVIGTPLDKVYPQENSRLQELIAKEHLLVSQFPIGSKTYPSHFPQRNKLMAVLSDGTVVMEASDTSGTLHQAAECTRLGRWLFIAKSVVDDRSLEWPKKFLKYETCIALGSLSDITRRIP